MGWARGVLWAVLFISPFLAALCKDQSHHFKHREPAHYRHLRKMEQWSKLPSWACLMQAVLSMRDAGLVWALCGLHFQFHQLVRCLLLTLWWVSFLFLQGDTVHLLLFWQVQLISVLSGATLNHAAGMVSWGIKFAFTWDPKLKATKQQYFYTYVTPHFL